MKTIIIITILALTGQAQASNMMQFLKTVQEQKNNWDNYHYNHIKEQQMIHIRARQGAYRYQNDRQHQNQRHMQLRECAPNNTYCQGLRQRELQIRQFQQLGY